MGWFSLVNTFKKKNSFHIIFKRDYLRLIKKGVPKSHATWMLKSNSFEYIFGGKLDSSELNNLITFEPIPEFLEIKSITKISFGLDFELFFNSIIDGKILSYKHNEIGFPNLLSSNIKISNSYSNFPLKKTKVRLAKTPHKFYLQEWEGNCNKTGVSPIWAQKEKELLCPICSKKMNFIFQLDSGLPDENPKNDFEIMFGNDGMLYAFWCDDDKISSYIWQST